jgi:hypothetical protein
MKHKRTHQLKRHGDYWTIARTSCGREELRKNTTTTDLEVTCPDCARDILMIYQNKINQIKENVSPSN